MFLCDDEHNLTVSLAFYMLNVLRFLKGSAGYPVLEKLSIQDGGVYCTGFPLLYTMGLWDKGHIHEECAVIFSILMGRWSNNDLKLYLYPNKTSQTG